MAECAIEVLGREEGGVRWVASGVSEGEASPEAGVLCGCDGAEAVVDRIIPQLGERLREAFSTGPGETETEDVQRAVADAVTLGLVIPKVVEGVENIVFCHEGW